MFCILDKLRLDINDKHMKQQVMLVISNFEYLTFRTINAFLEMLKKLLLFI